MAFIYERKPHYRVYDPERNLELGQGLSGREWITSYFHPIGHPDTQLGGVYWHDRSEQISADERNLFPAEVERKIIICVDGAAPSYGGLPIGRYDLVESIEIVKEALVAKAKLRRGKYAGNSAYEVEISADLKKAVEQSRGE